MDNIKQVKFHQGTEKNTLPTEGNLFLIQAKKAINNIYIFFLISTSKIRQLIKVY